MAEQVDKSSEEYQNDIEFEVLTTLEQIQNDIIESEDAEGKFNNIEELLDKIYQDVDHILDLLQPGRQDDSDVIDADYEETTNQSCPIATVEQKEEKKDDDVLSDEERLMITPRALSARGCAG